MNPKDLFKPGLSVPEHETKDLHYIGEALPVPSLVVSTLGGGVVPYVGASPVPAREDHVHDIDETSLVSIINDNSTEIFADYSTTEETQNYLDTNYYNQTQIDLFLDTVYETIGVLVLPLELFWSFGPVINNTASVFLNRYVSFRDISISYIYVSLVTSSSIDIEVHWWVDTGSGFVDTETVTLSAGDLHTEHTLSSPVDMDAFDQCYFEVTDCTGGDGEILTISLKGFYRDTF